MGFIDLLFPKLCIGCSSEGQYICQNCLAKVQLLKPVCPYCEKASIDGFTHTKCKKKYGLDGLTSIWKYEGVIKKAIWSLKFKYATEVGRELNGYMVEWLKSHTELVPNNYCLMPIPIHWYRENVRGFNQSMLIGKQIAEKMGWEFIPDVLVKKKPTASQVELTVKARKKNLRGAFSVPSNTYLTTHNSQPILVFDDVFTTGSTLHEAAKTLKRAGVEKVWGMTIAR